MIVADTNLVAYLAIQGSRTNEARRVWSRDPDWVLPPLWRSEFLNVLATMVAAKALSDFLAFRSWRRAKTLFGRTEREPKAEKVLQVAIESKISAYDAHFVTVAEDLGVPLVSFDKRLQRARPQTVLRPRQFLGLGARRKTAHPPGS